MPIAPVRGHVVSGRLKRDLRPSRTRPPLGAGKIDDLGGFQHRIGQAFERRAAEVALLAASDEITRHSVGDSFYLALFTGQRQTDRIAMRDESKVEGRHAFRQSKTGELVHIKEAPQLTARLNAARTRAKEMALARLIRFSKDCRRFTLSRASRAKA